MRNAARLLKEFSRGSREIGVTELSRRLGIGKSTAHRLLNTLAEERLLEQDPDTGAYRLGLAMYELGASVSMHTDLHEACSPVVDQLRNATRETVQVAVLDGREVVYVERRESPQTLRLFGRVGHRNDANCTSTGKLLLAYLPPDAPERAAGRLGPAAQDAAHHRRPRHAAPAPGPRSGSAGGPRTSTRPRWGSPPSPHRSATASARWSRRCRSPAPCSGISNDSLKRFARPTVEAGLAISRRLGYRDSNAGPPC